MEWFFKEELESIDLIKEFEEKINYKFPKDFKDFVLENNEASPEPNVFDAKFSKEHAFDRLLSFNNNDNLNIWNTNFDTDYKSDEYIIFGLCSFGDFLCFSRDTNHIIYLDHETMEIEEVASTFTEFINSFYDPEFNKEDLLDR